MKMLTASEAVRQTIETVKQKLMPIAPELCAPFERCFLSNLKIAAAPEADGSVFLVTGDIPAMWLRDSSCQLRPYVFLAGKDPQIRSLISGVIRRQMAGILKDPYANAHTRSPEEPSEWTEDLTEMKPGVWERKFEIDSLCWPFFLAWYYRQQTGYEDIFDETFLRAARQTLAVFRTEQQHESASPYRFQRKGAPYIDSLSREGRGALVREGTGLIWSGFRPSDDACAYGYLIPSNMFAVSVLEKLDEISREVYGDQAFAAECRRLSEEVRTAIEREAVVPTGSDRFDEPYYAYEVDGYGQYLIMDDANFPNLLSAPYLGYCSSSAPLYQATVRKLLSDENPYYYRGPAAEGLGSIHTRAGYVWPLSLGMRGLVTDDPDVRLDMARRMAALTAGTDLMHESVNVCDPWDYTRPLFGWANAIYCELILKICGLLS